LRRFVMIARFEGLALHVHRDGRGAEIGYGHELLVGERYPHGINERQAYALYLVDVARAESAVRRLAPQANQNQFDALDDFTYEMGTGALARLLAHGWAQVPAELPRWRRVNHRPVASIAARRQFEVALFLKK
jgi:GH24 family phage-related lysozyme (muramidase)